MRIPLCHTERSWSPLSLCFRVCSSSSHAPCGAVHDRSPVYTGRLERAKKKEKQREIECVNSNKIKLKQKKNKILLAYQAHTHRYHPDDAVGVCDIFFRTARTQLKTVPHCQWRPLFGRPETILITKNRRCFQMHPENPVVSADTASDYRCVHKLVKRRKDRWKSYRRRVSLRGCWF